MSLWISGRGRAFQEAGGAGAKALEQELAVSEPGWEVRSERGSQGPRSFRGLEAKIRTVSFTLCEVRSQWSSAQRCGCYQIYIIMVMDNLF